MGKVKKLRKKYRALCTTTKKSDEKCANLKYEHLRDLVVDSMESSNQAADTKSVSSISKSIKSAISGRSITKKDKLRLRRALFLNKLQLTAPVSNKPRLRKRTKANFKRNIPPLLVNAVADDEMETNEKRKNLNMETSTVLAEQSHSKKGSAKRQLARMIYDVNLLQKLIKDEKTSKNPQITVQQHVLEKLSQECLIMNKL